MMNSTDEDRIDAIRDRLCANRVEKSEAYIVDVTYLIGTIESLQAENAELQSKLDMCAHSDLAGFVGKLKTLMQESGLCFPMPMA
jgi:hypothetical protein